MSREILDCLKREQDICIQNIILSQNTALKWTPAIARYELSVSYTGIMAKPLFLTISNEKEFLIIGIDIT